MLCLFALKLVSLGRVVVGRTVIGGTGRKRGRGRALVLRFLGLWDNIFGVIVRF